MIEERMADRTIAMLTDVPWFRHFSDRVLSRLRGGESVDSVLDAATRGCRDEIGRLSPVDWSSNRAVWVQIGLGHVIWALRPPSGREFFRLRTDVLRRSARIKRLQGDYILAHAEEAEAALDRGDHAAFRQHLALADAPPSPRPSLREFAAVCVAAKGAALYDMNPLEWWGADGERLLEIMTAATEEQFHKAGDVALTTSEAATALRRMGLRVGPRTVARCVGRGTIPATKPGDGWYFIRTQDLVRYYGQQEGNLVS